MESWMKKYMAGKKQMLRFDFEALLVAKKISIEELALKINFTVNGIIVMIERGTMKTATFNQLKKVYPDAEKYLMEKKTKLHKTK